MTQPEKVVSPRYHFVDALRGLASLGVLLAHIVTNEVSQKTLSQIIPISLQEIFVDGSFGVQVFFVLSGFVIALSLSQKPLTWAHGVNFALRRQLRLDPPYLVAMVGLMLLHAAFGRGFPDAETLALNGLYLHNFVKAPQILGVAWTLCLEIQFYATFLLILGLDRWLGKGKDAPISPFAVHALWMTGLLSILASQNATSRQIYTFGYNVWFYFAAGALCYWSWRGLAPSWTLGVMILGMTLSAFWSYTHPGKYITISFMGIETGVVTTLALFMVAGRGQLESFTLGRGVQFLGKVSYSLYLTHAFFIEALMWVTRAAWGEYAGAVIGLALVIPLSLLGAHVFYLIVERPSVKWAARFKV